MTCAVCHAGTSTALEIVDHGPLWFTRPDGNPDFSHPVPGVFQRHGCHCGHSWLRYTWANIAR